ncbi:MAG: hypothetical protein RL161_556 [Bacteroidota bacterium]
MFTASHQRCIIGCRNEAYRWADKLALPALKNGFSQILHSLSVEMDNQNIVQQTSFLNLYAQFKHLTTFSLDQLKEMGCSFLFSKDSPDSWVYNNTALDSATGNVVLNQYSGHGQGFSNNRALDNPFVESTDASGNKLYVLAPQKTQSKSDENQYNEGLKQRLEWLHYNTTTQTKSNRAAILSEANAALLFKSHVKAPANGKKTIFCVAKIELRHVCDYFQKCPTLMKGGAFKFYINVNQAECRFKLVEPAVANTSTFNAIQVTSTTLQNGSNPIMISSADRFQPTTGLVGGLTHAAAKSFIASLSVVRNNFTTIVTPQSSHSLTSTRLYCPQYVLNPLAESQLIKLNPVKTIVYDDIQLHIQRGVKDNFNFLCSNGISNLKEIVVIPFLNTVSNVGLNPLHSPFDSSVCHPIAVRNFNVQVSGKNLYQSNLDYDWEQFHNELKTLGINSGMTDGLSSGLLSEYDYSNMYRYLYSNVSRVLPSEEGVARSVNIMGQVVNSSLTVDFYCFMIYSKKITLDCRTGSRVD